MKSTTAIHTTFFRALEDSRGQDAVFADPFAARFLPPPYRALAVLARSRRINLVISRYIDKRWPSSPRATVVARTWLIDQLLRQFVGDDSVNIILVGAGYDTRPYRLDVLRACLLYEVDQRQTQDRKRKLAEGLRPVVEKVEYIAADLELDGLNGKFESLELASRRSCAVIEGVTNYLSARAVDGLFRTLRNNLRVGSIVVFTYVDKLALSAPEMFRGAGAQLKSVRRVGEAWRLGFAPAEMRNYLRDRGYSLQSDESTHSICERLFAGSAREDRGADYYRVVHAEIS